MATAFTTLGAEQIHAHVHALLNVLGVSNHVHVEKTMFMELVDDCLGGYTDSGYEKLRSGFNDDVCKLIEPSFGVVMASTDKPTPPTETR